MVSWRVLATGAVVVLTLSAPAPLWAHQGGAGEKKILLALWRGITEPEVAFKAKLTELGIKAAYTEVVGDQDRAVMAGRLRALDGDIAAGAWWNGEHGLLITAAVPVKRFKQVVGAVLMSRTGTQIDRSIRSVRVDILRVVAGSLTITVLLSLYLAGTIARPIRRLALAADRVRRGHGRPPAIPDFTRRRDEIGDLSRALRDMTAALWTRMDAIERFAAQSARRPQPEVHLRIDQTVAYRAVAETLADASNAGLTRIGFVSRPDDP